MKKIALIILTFCLVSFCLVPNLFAKKATAPAPTMSLHESCEFGSFTEVKEAIQSGAPVNGTDEYGVTPLMASCRGNSSWEIIQLLIASGAKVNVADSNGKTPLMYAAEYDSYEKVLKEIIKAGANVNAKTEDGMTALMFACENTKNIKVVQTLISSGANVNATDNGGYDMADYAEGNKNKAAILEVLTKAGFKPSIKVFTPEPEQIDNSKSDIGMNTEEQDIKEKTVVEEDNNDLKNIGVAVANGTI